MSDKLPGMEEAQKRFEDSRWEVDVNAVNGSVCVDVHRDLLGIECSGIYVREPNLLERVFGISTKSKVRKAIRKQQKSCDKLNSEIDVNYKLEAITKSILEEENEDVYWGDL